MTSANVIEPFSLSLLCKYNLVVAIFADGVYLYIKCPTLLIWGTNDAAVSYNDALDLEKMIDNNIYMVDDFEITLKCKQFVSGPTPKSLFDK